MRTTTIATLLVLGTLAILSPIAAADSEVRETQLPCISTYVPASSTSVGPVTVETRHTHVATVCIL